MALRPRKQVSQELLAKVTKTLGITSLDQWYHVSNMALAQAIGPQRSLMKYGGTVGFLQSAYPHHQFDEERLGLKKKLEKDQRFMEVIIRLLFPNTQIQTKARSAVGIKNPETGAYLEIDFWIPSLKLGIEYQDRHHYEYQWYANGSLADYQNRDNIKKAAMPSLGYTLITIGYWWDKTLESVVATIRTVRPDLLEEYKDIATTPIPSDPPVSQAPVIPGVYGIMSPFIPGSGAFNPTNWYAGEKHDGIRGIYNPKLQQMFSRLGNELSVHPLLLQDVPKMLVEGEIVAGRGNYNKTAVVSSHRHHDKVYWPIFRYVIYDIPDAKLGNYVNRYSAIVHEFSNHPFVFSQSTFRVLVASKAHLKMLMDSIISDAGEGVIVQKDALYEYGRSKSIAKIKVRREDDAQVLRVNKHSCSCKLFNGGNAEIKFSNDFKERNLRGEIVSFYHSGYSANGKPKHAEIYKVRYDLAWDSLVSDKEHSVAKRRSVKEAIGGKSLARVRGKTKIGHWNKAQNVRAFFDDYAHTSGFDPLVPENWYSVPGSSLRNSGGHGIFKTYGRIKHALARAYPELKFEAEKFRTRNNTIVREKSGHWKDSSNVRAFLAKFARAAGFDPLVLGNWSSIRPIDVKRAGGAGLLNAYNANLKKALSSAFPELKFDADQSISDNSKVRTSLEYGHWYKTQNVRAFFDEFAGNAGFDPLVPENWNSVKTKALINAGGRSLLHAFKFDLKKALSRGYPTLKLEHQPNIVRNKLDYGHWNNLPSVREFFDEFARKSGFNPLNPEHWYSVKGRHLRNVGGGGLLNRFSFKEALVSAYPEVQFDEQYFRTREQTKARTKLEHGHWNNLDNVRTFFDGLARTQGFEPQVTENWFSIKSTTVRNAGGSGIFNAYGSLNKALSSAYPELRFEEEKFIAHDRGNT